MTAAWLILLTVAAFTAGLAISVRQARRRYRQAVVDRLRDAAESELRKALAQRLTEEAESQHRSS